MPKKAKQPTELRRALDAVYAAQEAYYKALCEAFPIGAEVGRRINRA